MLFWITPNRSFFCVQLVPTTRALAVCRTLFFLCFCYKWYSIPNVPGTDCTNILRYDNNSDKKKKKNSLAS